jgi:hypothetical protein
MGLENLPDLPGWADNSTIAFSDEVVNDVRAVKEADFVAEVAWLKENRPRLNIYLGALAKFFSRYVPRKQRGEFEIVFRASIIKLLTVLGDALAEGTR